MKVFSVEQMVAAEKAADAQGVTYEQMMETAGRAVAEAIIARFPIHERKVTVLVGPGNNGGDGLVAGRYLAEAGADVTFYLYKARDPEEDINLAKVEEMGLFVLTAEFDQRYRVLRTRLNITDIVIDALLGTGVSRPIEGGLAKLLKQVQAGLDERHQILAAQHQSFLTDVAALETMIDFDAPRQPAVVAVDCPSGLHCDDGQLDQLALDADLTVTFAGPKRGHFLFPGAGACGQLVVADIGISPDLAEVEAVTLELTTAQEARQLLPPRPRDGHKGTFGFVLIVAGSGHYWGAPVLAGRAAYRSGAGLVALASPAKIRPVLAGQLPEATYPPLADETLLGEAAAESLAAQVGDYEAVLLGPGLGNAAGFINTFLTADRAEQLPPLVIDADGLNLLAGQPTWWERLPASTILTPHPGEMARLCDLPLAELKEMDRIALAQEKAALWDCVLLLKGAYTVVAAPDGRTTLLPFANPALAVAGSGDVLSGVLVALLGQGVSAYETAVLGGYLHGAAAERAGLESGLLASEIADWLPEVRELLKYG